MERNFFRSRREHRSEDSYRPREEVLYHDDGSVYRVKVLANNSNKKIIKYNLQVREILNSHPFLKDLKVGSLFECNKLREAANHPALWHLTESI